MATPRRSTGRVTGVPRRVGRVLEQAVQTTSVYNGSLDVDRDGRLGVKAARGSGLVMTREGLALEPSAVGEMNRPAMNLVRDLDSGASTADLISKVNELLAELRRTKNMLGGGL